ncbi:MAG: hypothetical protein L3J86_03335, partial [Thermoplasmata archaeon]|nr:hypothetical protein [Thermoplasmata archaeon]
PYVPPPNSTAPHNNSTGGSNLGRSGSAGPAWTTTDALVISLLAAGLAILTIATGWVLWQRRRRAGEALVVSHRRIDPLVLPQVPGTAPSVRIDPLVLPQVPGTAPSVPEPPRPTVSLAAAIPAAREVPSGEPSGLAGSRRLTYQLVRHLARLPRLGPGDLPGREWTQAGIAESVGAGQSAVSRILRRLIGAGVVAV